MLFERFFENPDKIHVNTCENRAYYVPTSPAVKMDSYMEDSDRALMLSSDDWYFHLYQNPYAVQPFFEKDFCPDDFDTIAVPSCWQILGYDRHQYANVNLVIPFDPPYVPDENLSGAYIKYFALDKAQIGMKNYLNFEGVDSCLYVWVNGKFVGYSQVSHSTSEFDISDYVVEGENKLAVLVLKWCSGTYFEDQDKLRMSGIFRDVYILSRPQSHIRDFYVKSTLDESYTDATVTVTPEWEGAAVPTTVTLCDPDGNVVESKEMTADAVSFSVPKAQLWNAENPCQYQITIETAEETIVQAVGIRVFEVKGNIFYVNGQKVKFKGVNRHDSDPFTGYTIAREQLLEDLALMKQHNFNAIRTSHYPNAPWATQYYSEMGFYVIDESDIEMHGTVTIYNGGHEYSYLEPFSDDRTYGMLCHDPRFEWTLVDRVQRNVMRDKNNACVVLWSLGNEGGYGPNMEKAAAWIKSYDKDMLVHYESSMYQMVGYENDVSNLDVFSRMYAPTEAIDHTFATWMEKPFIQCEFVHAMGNGPGDIEDYFEQIYKYDGFTGGFVWEWCDHAIWMGQTQEGKDKYYYGGDWGEFPHDGNFCMDGLVYPDRRPHTGILEWKNCARPVRATLIDGENGIVELSNKLDFTNMKEAITLGFELSCDGKVVQTGTIAVPDVAPWGTAQITVPYTLPATGTVHLRLIYSQKEDTPLVSAGYEVGFDQLLIREEAKAPVTHEGGNAVRVSACDCKVTLCGDNFRYQYNKLTGVFDTMVKDQMSMLDEPMQYNIWRAPTDNDRVIRREWEKAGYDRTTIKVYDTKVEEGADCVTITSTLSIGAIYIQRIADVTAVWTVYNNGDVNIHMDVKRNTEMPFLPRFGLRMFLPNTFADVTYTGYGPFESYQDKRRASYYGTFQSAVQDLHEDYIRPQENGSHWGCDALCLAGDGACVSVTGKDFSFNVSPYTQEELATKAHNYELEEKGSTVICVDAQMSGIGSGSCGPQLKEKYQLKTEVFALDVDLQFGK